MLAPGKILTAPAGHVIVAWGPYADVVDVTDEDVVVVVAAVSHSFKTP
jgi:hypothetical protein